MTRTCPANSFGRFLAGLILITGMGTSHTVLAQDSSAVDRAQQILQATGVQGGLVVHIGLGDGQLTAALRASDSYLVHGLDTDPTVVQQARRRIRSGGHYGVVSVDRLRGTRLPYVDNLVNLVVSENLGTVPLDEVLRVLAPEGVAYVRQNGTWQKQVKQRPQDIDEWTHYFHDASGNAVAHDETVGPPRHLQWVGSPRWSRHHDRMASMSALVSSGGRMFYIMDEGSRVSIQLPSKWTLIARDAFNGTILWKRAIPTWHNHLWPLKSGPTQLARRLVATGNRVYVTLGFAAPLMALDAATGRTIRTYDESKATEEVITSEGDLFVLANPGKSELSKYAPALNLGDQRRVANEFFWNGKPRKILAIRSESGEVLWTKTSRVSPLTLAADAQHVLFYNGERVVCLNRNTGTELWQSAAGQRKRLTFNFGPKLVIYQDVVLFAGGDRKMQALDIRTGRELWSAPHAQSGYQSPEDLLVSDGLVWAAPTTRTGDSGVFAGRDPKTGEVRREFPPDVDTYWFHHRCYISKATDRFLMTSRTGIEFVDHQKQHWDIHHWVRGGCLYGIMPCNGLVYAPPHNCACYPEAKLYGLNALAPSSVSRRLPATTDGSNQQRLERGPAFGQPLLASKSAADDWPVYRHDAARSGTTPSKISSKLKQQWNTPIGSRLSTVVVSGGKLFVADIDAHTVHALDAASGAPAWDYTTGGRVDSPPTVSNGKVLFGSADGWVYCLRAEDGQLIWRFRAAPRDERLTAYEQLESVWPVHGSILVHEGVAYFVAGRSSFLDGGLRLYRLAADTGRVLTEKVLDDIDPETGENLQVRIKTLNMPVALPDILSSDGRYVYMRSQQFDLAGNRQNLGPNSGVPAEQASVQRGETAHLFSPTGFVDGSWFHRSYWVFGRSFAGGHAGYYQAGRFAPSGRILVFDKQNVYGFGRKPEYLKWTTTMEHQLFSTDRSGPKVESIPKSSGSSISLPKSDSLDPSGQPIVVEAWVKSQRPDGVVLAHGGPLRGYALAFRNGEPRFIVREDSKLGFVIATDPMVRKWVHLVGVLKADKTIELYVNGKLAGRKPGPGLITQDPAQGMQVGADAQSSVGAYKAPLPFTGLIDEVGVYHGTVTAAEIAARHLEGSEAPWSKAKPVVYYNFEKGRATDLSGNNNHGELIGVQSAKGQIGRGMQFKGRGSKKGGSFVKHHWTQDIPLLAQAMIKADQTLFVAGPPDRIDEEETLQKLIQRNPEVDQQLAAQSAALAGKQGGILRAVAAADGQTLSEIRFEGLPVWDGMAAANGRLYLATTDGRILCFGPK